MLRAIVCVAGVIALGAMGAQAETSGCGASGGLTYVCGLANAEDLVSVPGSAWVLSSGMAPGGGIYLVDGVETDVDTDVHGRPGSKSAMTRLRLLPAEELLALETFISHGLHIRSGAEAHATLYVVGHGSREAIEVFDVDASRARPTLTWVGCVPMPGQTAANSVTSLRDGSLRATVLMHPGQTFNDVFAGKPTGAVYSWSPGDEGFELMAGTELPGNNGIEMSSDEREMFVVSSGLQTISAFSNTNPSRLLRSTPQLDYGPDNVHMTAGGQLITGGPSFVDHECGELDVENVDLEEYASCPRGSVAATYDPKTLAETKRWARPANPDFSNATMALEVGDEIWIGTFSGDRIGVVDGVP